MKSLTAFFILYSSSLFAVDLDKPTVAAVVREITDASNDLKKQPQDSTLPKKGVVLTAVVAGGPCDKAELKRLDIITAINKKPVNSVDEFNDAIQSAGVGSEVDVWYFRTFKTPAKKMIWKKYTSQLTPIANREFILSQLDSSTDKVTGAVTYRYKHSPSGSDQSYIIPYIVRTKDGETHLRMEVTYVDKRMLFMKALQFKVDDKEPIQITMKPLDVKRDLTLGKSWEWKTFDVTDEYLDLLKSIAVSRSTTLRYIGDKYHDDREISAVEKLQIATVLNGYTIMMQPGSRLNASAAK